nr:membrane-bound lytic murein transglycosylase B [uncultured Gammaproteobacteria bacterium]
MRKTLTFCLLLGWGVSAFGLALDQHPEAARFIERMAARYRFDPASLRSLFAEAQIKPTILEVMERPAEAKPWYQYRRIFLTERRIQDGVRFFERYRRLLKQAERVYGVDPAIVVAILGVETLYGANTGSFRVLDALSTLAFAYPRRAEYFARELEQFLLLTREERLDPRWPQGSYAGAMGWPQFMPSSFRRYATDFDGDGRRDLFGNPADVIGSVANYFAQNGWQGRRPVAARIARQAENLANAEFTPKFTVAELKALGIPVAPYPDDLSANVIKLDGEDGPEIWLGFHNFYVITRYNRSLLYAMAVYQLAETIQSRLEERHHAQKN